MVKEIIDGFDAMLKPMREARAMRDYLAEHSQVSLGENWHDAMDLDKDIETNKLKKSENIIKDN